MVAGTPISAVSSTVSSSVQVFVDLAAAKTAWPAICPACRGFSTGRLSSRSVALLARRCWLDRRYGRRWRSVITRRRGRGNGSSRLGLTGAVASGFGAVSGLGFS